MPADTPPVPSAIPADDVVVAFRTQNSNIRGRLVRLGATLDQIVVPHAMPDLAGRALSEALALAALCGSALPQGGNLNLLMRSDGAVSILVADYTASGRLRGYARYDADKVAALAQSGARPDTASALGNGHLAITLDSGPGQERYQGVLAFENAPLSATAAAYFQQRESLPTFIRTAVAEQYVATREASEPGTRWHRRAGGLMVQSVGTSVDEGASEQDDDWKRVEMLAATVEDIELLDPALTVERLLLRLFHEEAVAIERVIPLSSFCRCSREKVENVLLAFGATELSDMLDDNGKIVVTCEFCTARYEFSLDELRSAGG
ncbi:Hsp33 family molecular chaperone HslO [Hyphomicrobium sp.]|uniref:Hsp33 family molecular chaperone HslO n=1 Tax=Hyphomicrobium sp. TaxID=82 RepID=UPI002D7A0655|nr:Hsp33 family molecular chaperone HslO [Hyphomicrobium sp.]HET6388347.1 Hsp33 family molecular chaperone HslO [Hyphomicrobium sp.]